MLSAVSVNGENLGSYTMTVGETKTLYPRSIAGTTCVYTDWSTSNSSIVSIVTRSKSECKIKANAAFTGSVTIKYEMCVMDSYYDTVTINDYYTITVNNGKITLTASSNGGDIISSTKVTLSSNPSSANIYYTLDGSIPTTYSTPYTSSGITIDRSCTLKAIATKSGYANSDVFSATFRILDSFTAKTAEGIDMKFKYIDADSKTCEVASYCIDESTSGKVTIPSSVNGFKVVRIGKAAFNGRASLTTVVIPSTVVELASGAFLNCSGLTSVTIPNGVTSIDSHAFERCSSLTSLTIPNSVTSIETFAFAGCSGLTSVTIPNSVTSIGDQSFDGCTGLTSLTIPNSVTSIGRFAFSGCTNLTSVTIPNSVTSIGVNAFNDCSGLKSIKILASDLETGAYAFSGLEKLEELTINLKRLSFSSLGLTNLESLRSFTCSKDLEYIDGVTYLDASPWANNLPDGLNYIGKVLYKYKGTMPSGTKIKVADGCTHICEKAFYKQPGLAELIIPSSVTSIGYIAIGYCDGLIKITVDAQNPLYDSRDNCNAIIEKATNCLIHGCTGTTIPSSVTSLGHHAFLGNTTQEEIVIPNNIDSIAGQVFYNNPQIKSILLGKNLRKIGLNAFRSCPSINTIISLNGFPEDINETAFDSDVYNNATLYVPEGCRNNYRLATGWSNFKNIVEGIPDGIDNVKITPYDAKRIYTPSGTSTTTVNKGINIINGKKYVVK